MISQQAMAMQSNLSSGMVNRYVHELEEAKLIKIENRNRRDKKYSLTPKGQDKLFRLLMLCSAEIVQLYAQARQELIEKFAKVFRPEGSCKVVLFGGSETAAMVIQAIHNFPDATIAGIVDNDPAKWGKILEGIRITPPESISDIRPDFIIIASFARQDEIFESIKHLSEQQINIIKLSTI